MNPNSNIGRHLGVMAAAQPQAPALKVPRGRARAGDIDYLVLSFAALDAEVDAWCARLAARGVVRGDRTLIMVRPGLPLIASVFALFRIGAVPVVVDPGMRLKSFMACVARTRPRALIGVPLAQLVSRVFRRPFRDVAARVPASASLTARLSGPKDEATRRRFETADSAAGELAAILFTSGSTGSPKGVCYEHGMFDAQVRLVRETYGITPGEVDLPLLPVFALFNPALGMTTVVPEIDPSRPAAVDPAKIVQAIRQESVTNSFGSPTLWRIIADHCRSRNVALPSLRRVLCAGAPVPTALWRAAPQFIPNGRLHSPYGATEALPVSSVSSEDFRWSELPPTRFDPMWHGLPARVHGQHGLEAHATSIQRVGGNPLHLSGAPIGRSLPGIQVKIIAISDDAVPRLGDTRELATGEIGEIIVHGAVVTKEYDALPDATRRAKIIAPSGAVWHRMGDCGYVDAEGLLWFCGRVIERVETPAGPMYTEPCEQVFRRHPRAARCALIGLGERGRQIAALVVETRTKNAAEAGLLARELGKMAREHPPTAAIARFYFNPRFPVDVRHNAKIHRLALAKWASRAKHFDFDPKP